MIDSLTGQGLNVRHACRILGVFESGYYAWKDRPDSPRTLRRIWLAGAIVDVHRASGGTYGSLTRHRDPRLHPVPQHPASASAPGMRTPSEI